jgi:hypothetical protein
MVGVGWVDGAGCLSLSLVEIFSFVGLLDFCVLVGWLGASFHLNFRCREIEWC